MSWSQLVPTDTDVTSQSPIAIAPSLLACDFAKLADEVGAVERAGVEFLHLDVMDGHFVPNLTFGPLLVGAIDSVSTVPLDTHLMIETPDKFIDAFLDAGADILTIHVEASTDVTRDLRAIRGRGRKSGLAFNPDKTFDDVRPYLEDVDLLLAMSVYPGFGGQSFISTVLSHIEAAANHREQNGLGYAIEIDGGINAETAVAARESGVDVLVAGTAIFRTPDYAEAISGIRG